MFRHEASRILRKGAAYVDEDGMRHNIQRTIRGLCILVLASLLPALSSAQERPLTPEQQEKQRTANAECFSCHSAEGLRIRLQGLPYLADAKEARKVVGEWPAYRVSSTHVMTLQHRMYDCYWQMRMPELQLGSDVSVALISYLVKTAEGGKVAAPGLKR